jgi:3-hydroxyacyl-CoA dehydrogenase/enoyl-CoA hydratase/3-hydroxybutyryl-CoA epimerase
MTYKNFTVETDADGIALVTWDMPDKSMNVFTEAVMDEIDAIIDQVVADDAIKGAVFTSGKKDSFSGGADITMIKSMFDIIQTEKAKDPQKAVQMLFDGAGRMSWLWRKLETCGKPWVSAINGTCMGGAFELSLACHGRVAADSDAVKMALPEVKIGIFPGAGGTQRVPRLTNQQDALQMMTQGSTLKPSRARAMGLIHEVVPPKKLIDAAKKMIRDGLSPVQPWDEKGFKLPGGKIYTPAGANLWPAASAILRRETNMNYPGAAAILKCVYEGLQVPFDTGLKIEQRYFAHVLQTTEAGSMIRSLFVSLQELNKGARRPDGVRPTKFKKIGVIGAGFMGAGIAYVTAKAGIPVVLLDRTMEAAEKGKAHSDGLVSKAMQKGRATADDKEKLLSLITPTTDYADLDGADLVIEAVFEDSEVKKAATEQGEAQLKPSGIFASNTSTIPITSLAKNSKRPKNFIGIHFFSPVDRMMLVEIIMGKRTGDKALAVAMDYVRAIKKTPIVVNDTRGFYVNRCVLRYMGEAFQMLVEGVPPAMIENAAKMAGMPVGPLALTDETAIDLAQKIMKQTIRDLGEKAVDADQMKLIDTMVDTHGRHGRKNGKGFYDYPAKPAKKHLWPDLKTLYPQQDADSHRLRGAEAAPPRHHRAGSGPRHGGRHRHRPARGRCRLHPRLRLRPLHRRHAVLHRRHGRGELRRAGRKLRRKYGAQFKVPKLLKDMAANGETFYGRFDPYAKVDEAA